MQTKPVMETYMSGFVNKYTVYTVVNECLLYAVAHAPAVTGSVFMWRFRVCSGQCGRLTDIVLQHSVPLLSDLNTAV